MPSLADNIKRRFAWLYRVLDRKYGFDEFNEWAFGGGSRGLGNRLWQIGDVVLIVLAGFLVAVVAGAALAFVGDIGMDDVVLSIILLVPAQYAGQLAVLAWIVRRRKTGKKR